MTIGRQNCICSQLSDTVCRTPPFNIINTKDFNIYSVIECIKLSSSQMQRLRALNYGSEQMYVLKTYYDDLRIIDSGPITINRCKGIEEIKYCPFCGNKFE